MIFLYFNELIYDKVVSKSISHFKKYSIQKSKNKHSGILVYKVQPEIIKSKIFTRFNFITKPCSHE